jgi:hypothetical protein
MAQFVTKEAQIIAIYTKQKLCYLNDRAADWCKRTSNKELFKGCVLEFCCPASAVLETT